MKKFFLFVLLIIVIIGLLIFGSIWLEKKAAEREVNQYLEEHGYTQDVHSKETKYNYKMGNFYIEIYYKKYPTRRYEYLYLSKGKLLGDAFEQGQQVETTEYLEGLTE